MTGRLTDYRPTCMAYVNGWKKIFSELVSFKKILHSKMRVFLVRQWYPAASSGHIISASEMTYIVSSGALNSTHSLTGHIIYGLQGCVCPRALTTSCHCHRCAVTVCM